MELVLKARPFQIDVPTCKHIAAGIYHTQKVLAFVVL